MDIKLSVNQKRRNLLKGTAVVAAGAAIAPGIHLFDLAQAKKDDEAVTSAVRWGILIDSTKCGDCDSCVTACHEENGIASHDRPLTDPKWIRKLQVEDFPVTVINDAYGNDLYEEGRKQYEVKD